MARIEATAGLRPAEGSADNWTRITPSATLGATAVTDALGAVERLDAQLHRDRVHVTEYHHGEERGERQSV